jgi:serpin B
MRARTRCLVPALALASAAACSRTEDTFAPPAPMDVSRVDAPAPRDAPAADVRVRAAIAPEELVRAGRACTTLGLALYAQLRAQPGNVLLAPAGVCAALAQLGALSGGEARREVVTAMGLDPAEARTHAALGTLTRERVVQQAGLGGVSFATRLYGAPDVAFPPGLTALTAREYGAAPESLGVARGDFFLPTINEWVADHTRYLVTGTVPAGALSARTRVFAVSGGYFRDPLEPEFEVRDTRGGFFQVSAGLRAEVPMMSHRGRYSHAVREYLQVVELADRGGDTVVDLLLPAVGALSVIEAALSPAALEGWLTGLAPADLTLAVPRVHLRSAGSRGLAAALGALGVRRLFEVPGAPGAQDLFHAAYAELSERPVERAVLDGLSLVFGGGGARAAPADAGGGPVLAFDRPFLVVIRDRPSGAVLFVGRVADPRDAAR